MPGRKRRSTRTYNQGIIVTLELLVIILSLFSAWLLLTRPECEPCEESVDVECMGVNASPQQCLGGMPCHVEQNQTLLIEYYSDNNFTVTKQDAQGDLYDDTITTGEIMREFGEKDIRGEGTSADRQLGNYNQYLCLVATNATEVSCIPAAIFW